MKKFRTCEFKDCNYLVKFGVLCEFHSNPSNVRGTKRYENTTWQMRNCKEYGKYKLNPHDLKKKKPIRKKYYVECKHLDCDATVKTTEKLNTEFCYECRVRLSRKLRYKYKSQHPKGTQ